MSETLPRSGAFRAKVVRPHKYNRTMAESWPELTAVTLPHGAMSEGEKTCLPSPRVPGYRHVTIDHAHISLSILSSSGHSLGSMWESMSEPLTIYSPVVHLIGPVSGPQRRGKWNSYRTDKPAAGGRV
jgi:hypothetical protein